MSIFTPVNQRRHTNIAVVRLKQGGKRFEIACYKNTVLAWRNGIEKDIDEVLQMKRVYENVGKGNFAKKKDLEKAFGTINEEDICVKILEKGQLQISDLERQAQQEKTVKEIARLVADKCVNPDTKRPIPVGMIERAIQDIHFALNPNKSVKVQAMDLIKQLKQQNVMPIERAQMRVRITSGDENLEGLLIDLKEKNCKVEKKEKGSNGHRLDCLIDPGSFRDIDMIAKEAKAKVDILSLAVQEEGNERIDEYQSTSGKKGNPKESESGESSSQKPWPLNKTNAEVGSSKTTAMTSSATTESTPIAAKFKCNGCNTGFDSREEHREHYKSEWHRFNQKRKVDGKPPLNFDDFREESAALLTEPIDEFDKLYM